jgi:hypothetical protein
MRYNRRMDTPAYFEQHPERFWISLAGATVFFLLSVRRTARSQGGGKVLAALATVVAGVQVVNLVRMRPGSGEAAIDWSA